MNLGRTSFLAAATVGLAALTGCPNPNTYGTPRTIEPGKVQVVAALEGVGLSSAGTSTYLPTLPTVGVRVGVADGVDLGARISNLSSLQVDGKFNFIKSNSFDMAVDPGLQVAYFGSVTSSSSSSNSTSLALVYFNLPLLLGINISHSVTLVLTPGITYLYATASTDGGSGTSDFASNSVFLARFGVGFNFRVAESVALQPEITMLRGFDSGNTTFLNFGFGGSFGTSKGAMPDYSTVH